MLCAQDVGRVWKWSAGLADGVAGNGLDDAVRTGSGTPNTEGDAIETPTTLWPR